MNITLAGVAPTYEPDDDQLSGVSIELAAFDGEVGNGTLPVPDAAAALTVVSGRQAKVEEIGTLISDGFLLDHDRTRGPQPAGTARVHGLGLADANALLDGFRIKRSRPAETDYARVKAFAAADGASWDTTWVLNANTVTMPAKQYDSDGGWTSELIPDVVEFTGKTLFLHDKAIGGRCLHYHNLTSGHTCGLVITDVVADYDGITKFKPSQPVRTRTSVDLRNDVEGRDQTGRVSLQSDATSIAAHDADGLQHQTLVQMEASSQADLVVKTAAYLASLKDDLDTWTTSIGPLDATALSKIRVGDLITVTSSVMGLTASAQRIAHETLTVYNGNAPGLWLATLELGAPIRRRARVSNRSFTDRVTHTPVQGNGVYTVGCYGPDTFGGLKALDAAGLTGGGNHGVASLVGANSVTILASPDTIPPGDSFSGGGEVGLAAADGSVVPGPIPPGPPYAVGHWEPQGDGYIELSLTVHVPTVDGGAGGKVIVSFVPFTAEGGSYSGASGGLVFSNSGSLSSPPVPSDELPTNDTYHVRFRVAPFSNQQYKVWPTSASEPAAWTAVGGISAVLGDVAGWTFYMHTNLTGTTWTKTIEITAISFCVGTSGTFAYHWTSYGPVAVQEAPDGATSTFTIPVYPGVAAGGYVHGTLHVFVDGLEQNKVETDPAAGTFTLSWSPAAGDTVTASWVVP